MDKIGRLSERDLQAMLRTLSVERRPGSFCFVDQDQVPPGAVVHATVAESEGTTAVVDRSSSSTWAGAPEFVAAWLTVQVHSSLDAVGLTAALSGALAKAAIPCNVLAGLHHDHLLVPESQADQAIEVLRGLREDNAGVEHG
jgi:uncharacterized protein